MKKRQSWSIRMLALVLAVVIMAPFTSFAGELPGDGVDVLTEEPAYDASSVTDRVTIKLDDPAQIGQIGYYMNGEEAPMSVRAGRPINGITIDFPILEDERIPVSPETGQKDKNWYELWLSDMLFIDLFQKFHIEGTEADGTVINEDVFESSLLLKATGKTITITAVFADVPAVYDISVQDKEKVIYQSNKTKCIRMISIFSLLNRYAPDSIQRSDTQEEAIYTLTDKNGVAHRIISYMNNSYLVDSPESGLFVKDITLPSGTKTTVQIDFKGSGQQGGQKPQWKKDAGGWWYQYANGGYPKNKWEQIDRKWYYFDASGYMQTGWKSLDGNWYYLGGDGAMRTGWKQVGKSWYYFAGDGAMRAGWQKVGGIWYYFAVDGAMRAGWQRVSGIWYYFGGDGAMRTGWVSSVGKWYYMDPSSGAMIAGTSRVIDGKTYRFDANGICTNP